MLRGLLRQRRFDEDTQRKQNSSLGDSWSSTRGPVHRRQGRLEQEEEEEEDKEEDHEEEVDEEEEKEGEREKEREREGEREIEREKKREGEIALSKRRFWCG